MNIIYVEVECLGNTLAKGELPSEAGYGIQPGDVVEFPFDKVKGQEFQILKRRFKLSFGRFPSTLFVEVATL